MMIVRERIDHHAAEVRNVREAEGHHSDSGIQELKSPEIDVAELLIFTSHFVAVSGSDEAKGPHTDILGHKTDCAVAQQELGSSFVSAGKCTAGRPTGAATRPIDAHHRAGHAGVRQQLVRRVSRGDPLDGSHMGDLSRQKRVR
jgi:hypothetical protein